MGKYWQLFLWSQRDTIFLFLKCSKMLAYRENGLIASRWWRRGICIQSDQTNQQLNWLLTSVHVLGVMKVWYNLTGRSKIAKFWFDKLFLSKKVEGIPTADMDYCPIPTDCGTNLLQESLNVRNKEHTPWHLVFIARHIKHFHYKQWCMED